MALVQAWAYLEMDFCLQKRRTGLWSVVLGSQPFRQPEADLAEYLSYLNA